MIFRFVVSEHDANYSRYAWSVSPTYHEISSAFWKTRSDLFWGTPRDATVAMDAILSLCIKTGYKEMFHCGEQILGQDGTIKIVIRQGKYIFTGNR